MINGFGAVLKDDAAEELTTVPEVKAVTLNAPTDNGTDASSTSLSGSARCPATNATTRRNDLGPPSDWDVSPLSGFCNCVSRCSTRCAPPTRGSAGHRQRRGRRSDRHPHRRRPSGLVTGGRSRVIASAVTNPSATAANDEFGHGTHVAGLIAGNSLNSPVKRNLAGRYMGVAPRANLISVKVSDDDGETTHARRDLRDPVRGQQQGPLGIRVMNLSLSSTVAESYFTDPLDAAAESAWSAAWWWRRPATTATATDAVSYAPGNDPYLIAWAVWTIAAPGPGTTTFSPPGRAAG